MGAITAYNVDKNYAGVNGYGRIPSNTIRGVHLAANTAATITVPLTASIGNPGSTINKYYARITISNAVEAAGSAFVAYNAVAVLPAAAPPAAQNTWCVDLGDCLFVRAGDFLSFISPGTPYVSVEFYGVQG
jgi:hypothetical protein